jgi:hypothetical protein
MVIEVAARGPLMRMGRRHFLAACMALAGSTSAPLRAAMKGRAPGARFLAARRHETRFEAVLLDAQGHDVTALALPERGHSFAIDALRARAVIFGRQPGFYALAFALPGGAELGALPLPDGRHYFGHGTFSPDGMRLYATENDYEGERGVLGVYDATPGAQWRRLGEFDCGGIGPHEVVMLADGRTLCVANGGLLTHPDFGKTPLNLSTMRPSLAYLDARDGRLLEKVTLPAELHQLSIRHLVQDASSDVWFACQYEGPAADQPPLLGRHRRGAAPELLAGPADVLRDLRNYLGSIAFDPLRGVIATSSPVGGRIAWWDAASGRSLGSAGRPDGCGLAALDDGRFLISDGYGGLVTAGPGFQEQLLLPGSPGLSWDNHMRRL